MKRIYRALICILLAAVYMISQSTPASAASRVPDICNLLGVEGEYADTIDTSYGVTYDYYYYQPRLTNEEMARQVARYEIAMEDLGYKSYYMQIESDFGLFGLVFVKGDDVVELIYDANEKVNYNNLDAEGEISWLLMLCVPSHMHFTLGDGVDGVTDSGEDICRLCEGHGKCTFCSGKGYYYMGSDKYECGSCNGSRMCSICGGHGVY